jgi:D-alanine-D-alanine ligase
MTSRTDDPTGLYSAQERLSKFFGNMGMTPVDELSDPRVAWTWQTKAKLDKGTLLIGHLDVPMSPSQASVTFRRDPEWLYGEGVGVSRAPLVSMQYALRALRNIRALRRVPLGVLYYADEGRDCRYSGELIARAASRASRVLVLRPGNLEQHLVNQRRGWRKYQLTVSGNPRRLGQVYKRIPTLQWVTSCLDEFTALTRREQRLAVACSDLKSMAFPGLLPHRVTATILVSYLDPKKADTCENAMRKLLKSGTHQWTLELVSDRPPMKKSRRNDRLVKDLKTVAGKWEIPLDHETSLYPSVAGLVPAKGAATCGVGPVARDLVTPHESVLRLSLMQRTLLLAQYLSTQAGSAKR